ncbi:MAG: class I SAM-dependent methyltransferase [Armatimonadetes bacterium]|nr:class I SAM-dependent methyltransferase [Armatimonadota bacterium]MCX7968483.1 class I SAM-dependent methyltransferase [Armatimonadota bacterium]MDW8144301.1 class I SAM-dependent methyltransferase [Armatimonadota bacterium]
MFFEHRSPDWDRYVMDYRQPFRQLEPLERESRVVEDALLALRDAGILPHINYDREKFLAHRQEVASKFEIPWTAITPRMHRLIYAVNAIIQPKVMVAAGIFCGFTFICNAGAAIGAGKCYDAERLIGIEIKPEEAARAERNVRKLTDDDSVQIIAADAVEVLANFDGQIDLLYLDADGAGRSGKGVYLDILLAAWDKMRAGSIILAHNSVNLANQLRHYLEFVRNSGNCRVSVNIVVDGEGLEVSMK